MSEIGPNAMQKIQIQIQIQMQCKIPKCQNPDLSSGCVFEYDSF